MLLFLAIVSFSLSGCAGVERAHEDDTIGMKERLVTKDIGRHDDFFPPRWCGRNGLLFSGDKIGVELIDLRTGKRVQISEDINDFTALNCSQDGKWVLYNARNIVQTDRGEMAYDEFIRSKDHDSIMWTQSIYRYEVATGRREKVGASGRDEGGPYEALSPDGTKVLLGNRMELNNKSFVKEWEPVWFSTTWWERYKTKWLPDSSGVYHSSNNPNQICIEIFGDGGWAKCFNVFHRFAGHIFDTKVDSLNRIYFQLDRFSQAVHRCHIGDKELSCRVIGYSRYFAITPDNRHIFKKLTHKDCIRLSSSWEADGECIADNNFKGEDYVNTTLVGVSPNGRWLAFGREYKNKMPRSADPYLDADLIVDLFVIDLKTE